MPLLTLLEDGGSSSLFRVEDGCASSSLKRLLATRLGVDVHQFYLTRNGRSLDSEDTFHDGDVVRVCWEEGVWFLVFIHSLIFRDSWFLPHLFSLSSLPPH